MCLLGMIKYKIWNLKLLRKLARFLYCAVMFLIRIKLIRLAK